MIAAAWDGHEGGFGALVLARLLASTLGSQVSVLHVNHGERAGADEILEVRRAFEGSEITPRLTTIADRSPAKALAAAADDPAVAMLVVGSTHQAGIGRVLPGPVAERLLGTVRCPLAIAPRGFAADDPITAARATPRVLAVGYDGSTGAQAALGLAVEIGLAAQATIRLVAIGNPTPVDPQNASPQVTALPDLRDRLRAALEGLPEELRALGVFERGNPTLSLLSQAERGVDLLLIGSTGHGRLGSALVGSTARTVLREARCPVILMPRT